MSTRKTWYRVDTDDVTGEELVVRKRTVNQPEGYHATIDDARAAHADSAPAAQPAKPPAQVLKPAGIQSQERVHEIPAAAPAQSVPQELLERYPYGTFLQKGTTYIVDNFGKIKNELPQTIDGLVAALRQKGVNTNATKLHKMLTQFAELDVNNGTWRLARA